MFEVKNEDSKATLTVVKSIFNKFAGKPATLLKETPTRVYVVLVSVLTILNLFHT